jgi:hypothetical protein
MEEMIAMMKEKPVSNTPFTEWFMAELSGLELLKKLHAARMTLLVTMLTEDLAPWEFAVPPGQQSTKMLSKFYSTDKLLGTVITILP